MRALCVLCPSTTRKTGRSPWSCSKRSQKSMKTYAVTRPSYTIKQNRPSGATADSMLRPKR
jgi:hypothetical protein